MKIVIDIPDFIYNALKEDVDCGTVNLNQAIVDGTVLPDGHGDLIDRDVAYDEFDKACCSLEGRLLEGRLLKNIPTVIPADK